jgi:Zn-finger nucleic acid-binding protein
MICPVCNVDLLSSEKQGREINYCPKPLKITRHQTIIKGDYENQLE